MVNDVTFMDADSMARTLAVRLRGFRTSGLSRGAVYHEMSMQRSASRLLVQIRRIRDRRHRRGRPRVLGHDRQGHNAGTRFRGYTAGGETTRESLSARAKALGGQPAISQHVRLAWEPSANPAICAASVTDPPPAR